LRKFEIFNAGTDMQPYMEPIPIFPSLFLNLLPISAF
jgi:hypothetical protein